MNEGELHVLNTGGGDITVAFNHLDAAERATALRMLKDMQTRGYAILVQMEDGTYTRAIEVDAERGKYVVRVPDEEPATAAPRTGMDDGPALLAKRQRGRPRKQQIDVGKARAVSVARSAGG